MARAGVTVLMTGVLAVAAAGPAAAHFCYKTGNPNNGANGQAWMTKAEWMGFIDSVTVDGVAPGSDTTIEDCQAGVDAVKAHVAALPDSTRIMGPALLAGGTFMTDRTPQNIGYTPVWLIPEDCILGGVE